MRDPEAVQACVDRVAAELGPPELLVNSAAGNFICPAIDLSPNGWRAVVDIVLNGTFYCSRAVARALRDAGRGGVDPERRRDLRVDGQPRHRALGGGEGRASGT